MNKFYLFVLSTLLSLQVFASNFYLSVNSSTKMTVLINSQTQTSNSNSFTFTNLSGGFTYFKVYDAWTNMVLFNNAVNIALNSDVYATLDAQGNMNIYQVTPQGNQNNFGTVGTVTYNNTNNGNNQTFPPHFPNGTNNESFAEFVAMLKKEGMDSNKLELAQTYVSKSNLTVTQIKQICKEFSFDSNRLEFAKSAYATCTDKGNYVLLKDAFGFSSNYDDLMEYVKSH